MAAGGAADEPARPGPPGPAFVFEAAADWQHIDFISDLHLSAAMPRTFAAWSSYMAGTRADAVLILGDLFEVWVGDDARNQPFEAQCVQVLREAGGRRQLGFMAGNRDFLLGSAMHASCGLVGLPDPTVLSAWGQRLLLSHGDAWCTSDLPYQRFRAEVRQPGWQHAFLARPLAERLHIAQSIRQHSAGRRQFDGDMRSDVDLAATVAVMRASASPTLVHGHTHRPGSELLAPGLQRHVLSDWDLDDPATPRAEVLRLSRDGLQRLRPEAAS